MHTQNKQNRRRGEHPPTQLHKPEPKLDEDRRQELRVSFTHKHVKSKF